MLETIGEIFKEGYRRGWVTTRDGNASLRYNTVDHFHISPKGVRKQTLQPDMFKKIGIGEDMADISAMAICSEYLRDFQEKNNDLIPIRYLSFEVFYTYFAFQQKQVVKKRALSAQLKTNPHPLNKYRCNVPLSRSKIFRAIYNVEKGDGMWWHNTNQVW